MRMMPLNAIGRLESTCRQLRDAVPEQASWKWDDDYIAALAVVRTPHDGAVLTRLRELFPHAWSNVDIDRAPEQVRHVCGIWGGLMRGQRVFVLDPHDDPMLFAAWWPWGNGTKFSLRVSCYARSTTVVKAAPQEKVRRIFVDTSAPTSA